MGSVRPCEVFYVRCRMNVVLGRTVGSVMWGVTTCGKQPIGEYENGEGMFCLKVCEGYERVEDCRW